jgi:hypothetical protein
MKYLKKIIFYINKKISLIIIILVFAMISKFFTNIYNLYYRDYSERMNINYGYCNKESYGYVKKIKDIYLKNDKKVYLINFETYPSAYGLFYDLKVDLYKTNLILLNFDGKEKKMLDENNINLNDYNLLDSQNNCFFYKKR